jgi:FAD:protein FMN transferase
MGLSVHLTLVGSGNVGAATEAVRAVFDRYDRTFSRFRADSELMRLHAGGGEAVHVSELLFEVIAECLELARRTNGLFDPSVGGYLARSGYGLPHDYVVPDPMPTYRDIVLDPVARTIRLAPGQILEPAAVVKGRAVDAAGEALRGWDAWMINAAGDALVRGDYPGQQGWHLGIQDPDDHRAIVGAVRIRNEALATSGTYQTALPEGGHHLLDARTGEPVQGLRSVSAIAPSAAEADTAASRLLLTISTGAGYPAALPYQVIDDDRRVRYHGGFEQRLVKPLIKE